MRRFLFVLICLFTVLFVSVQVQADELEDITKQLQDLTNALESSKKATANNEQELAKLNTQLEGIKNQVEQIEIDISEKETEIDEGEKLLSKQKLLLDGRVVSYYKNKGKEKDSLLQILMSDNLSAFLQQFTYQQSLLDDDRRNIIRIALMVNEIEEKKELLEDEKNRLIPIKEQVDKQSAFLAGEVTSAKNYQGELNQKIADLSAKQQEILNAKSGSFTFSLGSGELADEYLSSIKGFREQAPAGSFAIFSFGAYTHRNGMSQYGARARAESGQNAQAIVSKYYPGSNLETRDLSEINVEGHGTMSFEDRYLLGIAEMPSSWHAEALKAQAIAARTYAYANKDRPGGICTTEACQVFSASKADNPPQSWRDAVQATRGQVLIKDGNPTSTQYSSTAGGYLNTSGWDTTDGGGGGSFIDKSYEKLGGSPWLYKAWWREHYSNQGATCGLANPWLSSSDMADIINAAMVMTRGGSGADTGRVTPITTSCWGGNPYSHDDLRNISQSYGGGIGSVSSVSVLQGDGNTNEVVFQTDKGEKRLSGADFKKGVSLRAPGYIRIPQSGFSFFNIEKK